MRYIPLLLAINLVVLLSSCNDDNAEKELKKNVPSNETTSSNEIKEQVQEISSFDFINKYQSDNFYKDDINGKKMAIKNLIVDEYQIENNGTVKLYCMAYSPEKSQIYLSEEYITVLNAAQNESNIDYHSDESKFQIKNNDLTWIRDKNYNSNDSNFNHDYIHPGCYDGMKNRPMPDCSNSFLIILSNPRDIKTLTCYDGAISNFSTKCYNSIPYYYKYLDAINIEGVLNIGHL